MRRAGLQLSGVRPRAVGAARFIGGAAWPSIYRVGRFSDSKAQRKSGPSSEDGNAFLDVLGLQLRNVERGREGRQRAGESKQGNPGLNHPERASRFGFRDFRFRHCECICNTWQGTARCQNRAHAEFNGRIRRARAGAKGDSATRRPQSTSRSGREFRRRFLQKRSEGSGLRPIHVVDECATAHELCRGSGRCRPGTLPA